MGRARRQRRPRRGGHQVGAGRWALPRAEEGRGRPPEGAVGREAAAAAGARGPQPRPGSPRPAPAPAPPPARVPPPAPVSPALARHPNPAALASTGLHRGRCGAGAAGNATMCGQRGLWRRQESAAPAMSRCSLGSWCIPESSESGQTLLYGVPGGAISTFLHLSSGIKTQAPHGTRSGKILKLGAEVSPHEHGQLDLCAVHRVDTRVVLGWVSVAKCSLYAGLNTGHLQSSPIRRNLWPVNSFLLN